MNTECNFSNIFTRAICIPRTVADGAERITAALKFNILTEITSMFRQVLFAYPMQILYKSKFYIENCRRY